MKVKVDGMSEKRGSSDIDLDPHDLCVTCVHGDDPGNQAGDLHYHSDNPDNSSDKVNEYAKGTLSSVNSTECRNARDSMVEEGTDPEYYDSCYGGHAGVIGGTQEVYPDNEVSWTNVGHNYCFYNTINEKEIWGVTEFTMVICAFV